MLSACTAIAIVIAGSAAFAATGMQESNADPRSATIHPELWPALSPPTAPDPRVEARITELMSRMTVEEKVGQTVQGDIASITPDDLKRYPLGSVYAGGNSDPGGRYNASAKEWLELVDAFYEASVDRSKGGAGIPILFGIDAMHGQSNVVAATLFPHNVGLGATRNPELIRRIGEITALETRVTGMDWTFAPTVAVPQDVRWGRSYEGYSESAQVVAQFSAAMVKGLQGEIGSKGFLDGSHVMSSVKHFVGDGGTTAGKDQGDTQTSEEDLRDIHAAGYPPAITAGAQSVMASFNSFHGEKLHGFKPLLHDVLKERMQFDGFVVGDWNGHGQVKGCTTTDCPHSLNAGVDMIMAPDSWKGLYESQLRYVKSGVVPMGRLDEAVRRILRVKIRMGLLDAAAKRPVERLHAGDYSLLGAKDHREVARQAVRESLVLLKNQKNILPISAGQHILIAGDGANDMGKQSGGWTLNWQGTGTTREDYPNATTILEGLRHQIDGAGGSVEHAVDGQYKRKPDVAIVVYGEDPYAEFQGDIPTLMYKPGDDSELRMLRRLKSEGIPVVSVFLSGRPLWVNPYINASDAFVAAWLPGSEGEGIADVLLRNREGKPQFDFKGKLSFSWPRTAVQYAQTVNSSNGQKPQFPFGYGLTYGAKGDLAKLDEASGVSGEMASGGVYFSRGKPAVGMRLTLSAPVQKNMPLTVLPAKVVDGSLEVTAIDHLAQEDALLLNWSGAADASFIIEASKPIDLSRESNGDLQLTLALRRDSEITGPLEIALGCGPACSGGVDLAPELKQMPVGKWVQVGIPLKCFVARGTQIDKVSQAPAIRSADAAKLGVGRIALGALNEAPRTVSCR